MDLIGGWYTLKTSNNEIIERLILEQHSTWTGSIAYTDHLILNEFETVNFEFVSFISLFIFNVPILKIEISISYGRFLIWNIEEEKRSQTVAVLGNEKKKKKGKKITTINRYARLK